MWVKRCPCPSPCALEDSTHCTDFLVHNMRISLRKIPKNKIVGNRLVHLYQIMLNPSAKIPHCILLLAMSRVPISRYSHWLLDFLNFQTKQFYNFEMIYNCEFNWHFFWGAFTSLQMLIGHSFFFCEMTYSFFCQCSTRLFVICLQI